MKSDSPPRSVAGAKAKATAAVIAFECLLDEHPDELVPKKLFASEAPFSGPLIVNPSCQFGPAGLARLPFVENFSRRRQTVWLLDPATDSLLPFWVGPTLTKWLDDARPGEPLLRPLPPRVRSILAHAGVLVPPDYKTRRRKQWDQRVADCRSRFQKGFVELPSLLHPFHIAALRRYYRELMSSGRLHPGDDQCRDRWFAYNESVARFFQYQLTPLVSDILGRSVQPSFAYVVCYRGGAELSRHVDREQCEFSISLSLDFVPEPEDCSPWPLYLETEQGTVSVSQAIGDALLFKGIEVPHYRPKLAEGNTSTSMLFFYVRRDFNGPLE